MRTEVAEARVRPEEEWARRIVALHLGAEVEVHDDGRRESAYDLRIGPPESPVHAIEVTGAIDEDWAKTWNTGPAKGPWHLDVAGDWTVVVAPGANLKGLRRFLPGLLADLESAGVVTYVSFSFLRWDHPRIYERAASLGVTLANLDRPAGAGRVDVGMDLPEGPEIDAAGTALPAWVAGFLRHDDRSDVLAKLAASGASSRDAFVIVTLDGAPSAVTSYLSRLSDRPFVVPQEPPDLPESLTGVWVVCTTTFRDGVGVRWTGDRWESFRSRGPGLD